MMAACRRTTVGRFGISENGAPTGSRTTMTGRVRAQGFAAGHKRTVRVRVEEIEMKAIANGRLSCMCTLILALLLAIQFATPPQVARAQDAISNHTSPHVATDADAWQPTTLSDAPTGRYDHTAIWTGDHVIVWGGYYAINYFLNDGYKYDPLGDTWIPISTVGAPIGRLRHTAIWTGQKMIVWGGESSGGGGTTDTGGIYDPASDTWTAVSTVGAPSAREEHSAVWTGQEMIVWGGCSTVFCSGVLGDGARYNPSTNSWTAMAAAPAWLGGRTFHQAVWTGSRLLIWGGSTNPQGGAYDPVTNTWSALSILNAPTPTNQGAGVWTGQEFVVWGGCSVYTTGNCPSVVGNGGRYNPNSNTWTPVSAVGAPSARYDHTGVWTGARLLIWGGCGSICYNDGSAYDPATDTWSTLSATNAPAQRGNHRAAWTGQDMVVWGGCGSVNCSSSDYLNTGGRYKLMGNIAGIVWNDLDGDGSRESGEPGLVDVSVELLAGGSQIGQTSTAGDGSYSFAALVHGDYTVREVQPGWLPFSTTPDEVNVTLSGGQTLQVDFGDWAGLAMWLPLVLRP
jgi:N-acetylneuraminic acid mutarotase